MKKLKSLRPKRVAMAGLGILVATALVASGATTAAAAEPESDAKPGAATALDESQQPIEITAEADGSTVTSTVNDGGASELVFELPGESVAESVDLESVPSEFQSGEGEPLSSTEIDGTVLTSYASNLGIQTLIEIPNAAAPVEYAFPFEVSAGATLELQPDGSVFVNDESGLPTAMLDVPWALDAAGNRVSTSFRVEGTTVIQFVDTSAVSAFPVVADPDLWWFVANSAGCLAEIAGLSLVGAKAVQVFAKADRVIRAAAALGKYYDALGGKVDKVIGVFKKWINNKKSLTRRQLTALEGLIREGAKLFFNAVGLGTCYNLVRGY
ncbi:MAG: hypothetical protein P0Y60_02815 [Candidatus Microbacterium colombiense]|nr:MAG: hypothetical protein P0Y60_02815 [Microbacterium sp.]